MNTYTTQMGENIMGICLRQLGNEKRWQEVAALNVDKFPRMLPHSSYPIGTILNMPNKKGWNFS